MDNNQYYSSENEQLEWKTIILRLVNKIVTLSTQVVHDDNFISFVKTYQRSVGSLGDLLITFFDEEAEEEYEKYKKLQGEINDKYTSGCMINHGSEGYWANEMHDASTKYFRALNKLLKRNDFLKDAIYSEDDDSEELNVEDKEDE